MEMNETNLPNDVITTIENDFIEDIASFEFENELLDLEENKINELEKTLYSSGYKLADDMVHYALEEIDKNTVENSIQESTDDNRPITDSKEQYEIADGPIEKIEENTLIEEPTSISPVSNSTEIIPLISPISNSTEIIPIISPISDSTEIIPLENHPIVHEFEDGIFLAHNDLETEENIKSKISDEIKHHPVEAMSHEEIQNFLKHDAQNENKVMNSEEILDKLDKINKLEVSE
jgi:hypothetical protein